MAYRVKFTKHFTGGVLKGLKVDEQITYPTKKQCEAFVKRGVKGVHKPIGGSSPYKIIKFVIEKAY
jgi:hypothetical protein